MKIGTLENYYGDISVKEEYGEYFWTLEDWDGVVKEKIPEYLYRALIKFELERQEKYN